VGPDNGSVTVGKAHRTLRKRERMASGACWQESGRAFTAEDGAAIKPERISLRFKELARDPLSPFCQILGVGGPEYLQAGAGQAEVSAG